MFVSFAPSHVNGMRKETARVTSERVPGPPRYWPIRGRSCAAPRAPLWAPAASALFSGAATLPPSGHCYGSPGSDDRALSAHFATPALPGESHYVYACCFSSSGVPAPVGPADKPPPRTGVSSWGPQCIHRKLTPGFCRACEGAPPPAQSGTRCPSAVGPRV